MSVRNTLERYYPHAPVVVQNLLISGQGLLFRKQRYGGRFPYLLAAAADRARWNVDRLAAWQVVEARKFLEHAGGNSPFWRQRFRDTGFDPSQFSVAEDIRNVPVLEKEDLRREAERIACSSSLSERLIPVHTSGTTGKPVSVAFTFWDMQTRMAFLHRMLLLFGIEPLARSVRFSGRTLFPNASTNRVFWRINKPMNQMLMSSYHLHPENLQEYVNQIVQYRPALIDGYPSAIYIISRFLNSQGQSGRIRPRAIMTTAETLEEYQRAEISLAFGGAPVVNQYASSEGAPFITQDRSGAMVINVDSGLFEFVKAGSDVPAKPGEVAEMLVTSFTTHAYPLIRYRIGDTVLLPDKPRLSSDWQMPVVEQVLGRQEDIIFTPERGFVGRLDPVFKKSPATIIESQIIQTAPMAITLKVVPDRAKGYHSSQLQGVINELRDRLGGVDITVEEVDSLRRGANGKLRAVIGLKQSPGDGAPPIF